MNIVSASIALCPGTKYNATTVRPTTLSSMGKWIIWNEYSAYRQSQVRKSTGSGVEWDGCSLIILSSYCVRVFSLILDSSVGLSASIQSAGDLVSETLVRILHSAEEDNLSPLDSKIACPCQSFEINNSKQILYKETLTGVALWSHQPTIPYRFFKLMSSVTSINQLWNGTMTPMVLFISYAAHHL